MQLGLEEYISFEVKNVKKIYFTFWFHCCIKLQ